MRIADIAEKAGVSLSTVSRVMNDVPSVHQTLREKVINAIEELKTRPSGRRSVPGTQAENRKTGHILLLICGHNHGQIYQLPVFPQILSGIETGLDRSGFRLMFGTAGQDPSAPFNLHDHPCDGVIVLGAIKTLGENVLRQIQAMPTVIINRPTYQVPGTFDRALYNNDTVSELAARYLLNRGHRRVAYVTDSPGHVSYARRKTIFDAAIRSAGASVTHLELWPQDMASRSTVVQKIKPLRPADGEKTGWFVSNDRLLLDLYPSMTELGMKPQVDVDLVSCNRDLPALKLLDPAPATIDIHPETVGRHAARQLIWRMANPHDQHPVTLMIEPELIQANMA